MACEGDDETMNNRMTEEYGSPRNPLVVDDIPTPEDLEQGKTDEAQRDAERIVEAVRQFIRHGRHGTFDPVGRGVGFAAGALARANEILAPRGWVVRPPLINGGLHYTLAPLNPPSPQGNGR
jgi:hypothetical protein